MICRFHLTARGLRAAVAIVVIVCLLALFTSMRTKTEQQEQDLVFRMSALSWKMSETLLEAQKLQTNFLAYEFGRRGREDLILATEIFWSRVNILAESEISDLPRLQVILEKMQSFLTENEQLIYQAEVLTPAQALALCKVLKGINEQLRDLWISDFLTNNNAVVMAAQAMFDRSRTLYEAVVASLLFALAAYLFLEIIIAQKAVAQERTLREAAMAASASKSTFLANVSHELRTPLNGIMGVTQILADEDLTADQRALLDVAMASGATLLTTINDVLDLSKVEAGRMDLEPSIFDPRKWIQQSLQLHIHRAKEKGLFLTCEIADDLPAQLRGDAHRLSQVINNLITNAIKFSASGGVHIDARFLGTVDDSAKIAISVTDSGMGIPPNLHEHIFEPFSQAQSDTSRQYGGTGLGLSISRKLCRMMGGDLIVQSQDGQGSCFTASFAFDAVRQNGPNVPQRLKDRSFQPKPTQCQSGHQQGSLNILVVDDSATNRLVIGRFLAALPVALTLVNSGRDAVDIATHKQFDLILMDVQMPDMDGIEATRLIRENPAHSDTPIFATTANVMSHQIVEYTANGMDGVLGKLLKKMNCLN